MFLERILRCERARLDLLDHLLRNHDAYGKEGERDVRYLMPQLSHETQNHNVPSLSDRACGRDQPGRRTDRWRTILRLPIYLDSIGTILIAAACGPVYGMIPNVLSGLVLGMTSDIYSLYFAPVGILFGFLTGLVLAEKKR